MSDLILLIFISIVVVTAIYMLSKNENFRPVNFTPPLVDKKINTEAGSNLSTQDLLDAELPEESLQCDSSFTPMTNEELEQFLADEMVENVKYADMADTAEMRTRRLIGDEAFDKMSENVDKILERHRADRSVNVQLTAGPDTPEGSAELHKLLPGDPLWLRKTVEGGMDVVDVYSGGFRIGRLMLGDAARVISVMDSAVVTGSYVSEQNGFGDCDEISLGIVVFHSTPQEYEARREQDADSRPWRITIEGPQRIVLYQN